MNRHPRFYLSAMAILCFFASAANCADNQPPQLTNQQKEIAQTILVNTVDEVKRNYYDPQLHGVDLAQRVKEAEERIRSSKSYGDAFAAVAWTLDALNDSHTIFVPPSRPYEVENGWEARFIGDKCFITAVKPGSDAEKKGVKPGDQLLSIEGFQPNRANFWRVNYIVNTLAPRAGMKLVLASPSAQPRDVEIMSEVKRLNRQLDFTGGGGGNDIWDYIRRQESYERSQEWRWVETADDMMILQIPGFFASDSRIDDVISRARKHKSLIIDLRGDPGGSEDVLTQLLSGVFQHEIKIANRVGRKERKPVIAKGRGDHAFSGNLAVLVDSRSASCSELFARTIQLEKRGLVVGDVSEGAVMEARVFPEKFGMDSIMMYAVEVTASDLIMSDGLSLEHRGVTPDVLELPKAEDLAADRDPQLAMAVRLLGGKISPEQAGKLFPVIWRMN